jgi:hypothetical protein
MVVGKGGPPPGLEPHLRVRLKPGWRWDARRRRFVSAAGGEAAPSEDLPPGSKIVPVAPGLAEAAPGSLSPDEDLLARHLQVILPHGADPAALLPRVRRWECVEKAEPPPEISLPGGPAATR